MAESRTGRNDPCPCGSGRKYKRCCLAGQTDVDLGRHRMRRAEGAVVNAVLARIRSRWGGDMMDAAWAEFRLWEERRATSADQAEFEQLFVPWLVFDWTPDPNDPETPVDWPTKPLALAALEQRPGRFNAFERRFIEAACARPYSFYAVEAVEVGRSLGLRDLITGREYTVREQEATKRLEPGLILFTRVIPLDDTAIMVGGAPVAIPPSYRLRVMDLRDDMASDGTPDEDALHDWQIELREAYLDFKDEIYNPPLPQLRNTDGDPILPTTLHFALACSPREAFERLASLAHGMSEEELLAESECDAAGELRAVRFSWMEPGNPMHRSWNNTIRGTLAIDGRTLVVDVNSERRATDIRAEVEKRLGELAVFERAVADPIEPHLEGMRESGPPSEAEPEDESAELAQHPEIQEALHSFMAAHWESWLDEKIPALRFATPREAARTPEGRERLEALLADFEWHGRHAAQPELRPDVAELRARLGL